ncbi:response regulator transcription factor [Clostridium sp. AWRP]|uniref:response regulator transcription factor n=1 Tax=Clostridium sp. AWRP TaxID=2212991 RepID=UPI001FAA2ADE|nr:response regulator transcription factor [Clostridium sp. AWRP]
MLADDHLLFLEGLQYMLKTYGIEVAGTARDGGEALEKARILKPDIILMDISMPMCSGIDALKLIKAEMSYIKIVMLTASEDDSDLFDAVRYGASGYILKNTDGKELLNMLADLEKGQVTLSPHIATRILKEFGSSYIKGNIFYENKLEHKNKKLLTKRQLEILKMVAKGITYKKVGETLGITERTVKYHMGRIIELLHVENRSQVIAYAAKIGVVKDKRDNM